MWKTPARNEHLQYKQCQKEVPSTITPDPLHEHEDLWPGSQRHFLVSIPEHNQVSKFLLLSARFFFLFGLIIQYANEHINHINHSFHNNSTDVRRSTVCQAPFCVLGLWQNAKQNAAHVRLTTRWGSQTFTNKYTTCGWVAISIKMAHLPQYLLSH